MKGKVILLVTLSGLSWSALSQDRFLVSDSSLNVGDEFTISWSFPNSAAVYISGMGLVEKEGSFVVKGERTMDVDAMVFEGDSIRAYHRRVLVDGTRSGESCRSAGEMGPAFTYTLTQVRLDAALERIHQLLQDTLKFPIEKEYHVVGTESKFAFETHCIAPYYLVSSEDMGNGIAERRIAYTITTELLRGTGKVNLEISSMIQYRRRAVRTWRTDNDHERHQVEAARLKNMLVRTLDK